MQNGDAAVVVGRSHKMTNAIYAWEAVRSGASITIKGQDVETDRSVKVSNVFKVMPARGGAVALTKGGDTVHLYANLRDALSVSA